ncbi:MAG: hypothetical protein AMXMBFR13_38160 [Phycisphaerae bacterium]
MNVSKPPIWAVVKAHLARDARKTTVLVVLAVVMVVVYARLFLGSGTPEEADAGQLAVPVVPAAPLSAHTAAAGTAETRVRPGRTLRRELTRDPFEFNLQRYPVDPDIVIRQAPEESNASTQVELVLQSTICGTEPLAWINGRCLRKGQEIAGFVVEAIEPTRVVLQRDGARLELLLK